MKSGDFLTHYKAFMSALEVTRPPLTGQTDTRRCIRCPTRNLTDQEQKCIRIALAVFSLLCFAGGGLVIAKTKEAANASPLLLFGFISAVSALVGFNTPSGSGSEPLPDSP